MRLVQTMSAVLMLTGFGPQAVTARAGEDALLRAGTGLVALPEPKTEGERLFNARCAGCHSAGKLYPGYFALSQQGAAVPELRKRTDLEADYVRTVIRNGIGTMPPLAPTYVGDAEIDAIAGYLAKSR